MISFDPAHKAVHYPPDCRFRIWIKPSFLLGACLFVLLPAADHGCMSRLLTGVI